MKKEELWFDSRDGKTKLHALRYTPDEGVVRGVVQIVHGMSEYVERYEEFAEFLTSRGFVVTGDDHLGHGKSVPEGGNFGYFCEQDPATVVVRDVHRLKKMTQELYPQVPYVIVGHSMGSFILRNYLCKYATGISGAVIMGTGMPSKALLLASKATAAVIRLFCGDRHVSGFINRACFGSYNKRVENPVSENAWLSANRSNVERYDEDPMCGFVFTVNGFRTLFELIDRLHKKENLAQIPADLPIFMISGAEDPVGDYGAGVQAAYDSLTEAGLKNVEKKLYEGDRHELLNEDDRETVMQDICDWIDRKVMSQT